ncbi:hypothetical protein K505DRAFT_237085 [Melanomma pulvis-pyrius CBS 109.77]|uniref:Carboxymuconolactone decarboxylase-like domain-containing protein n=1 Tax=Melanomma pulvis-pyrius CBS 109.77 TaxID=1314802 RepID=A0A6A6XKS6_9PLEO|nr:hypothetical protein K505DRAFT_237085 [Melanomma pulvis-pyrius CBS 109.77]
MEPLHFISAFRAREGKIDIKNAIWYAAAAAGLAATEQGQHMPELYRLATDGLPLEDRKIVQRRIKEAVLKGVILYGVPRSAQALGPLYEILTDEEIDTYGPRYVDSIVSKDKDTKRIERGRKYFDTLWTPISADQMRRQILKYNTDSHFCLELLYEHYVSEDGILSPIETQICYATLLTCYNAPTQALWHTRGIVRHGGTIGQARFAQDLGLALAEQFDCKTGDITMVDEIEF